ncbi:divalent-cation tolerance protein CutA [Roseitranquillus sediminis]|uniref:divalent-cation tolerance protein CutA n=1 Tax=Roseitranquillus sediminis TaxID=2809051 RepID=UPI001D0CA4D8|nr:divalent-cation tolerance protein CutA [Roseitranquillus sediminis]MBM9596167.1 divalent-cation tolerance protein CutA [Roseitranquillus sediminis]
MRIVVLMTNCPDAASARRIAEALIAERLVACANLQPEIESAYHWKGEVAREPERPLLLKTRAALWERAAARIRELHPYETPAVLGTVPDFVTEDYAAWVEAETLEP